LQNERYEVKVEAAIAEKALSCLQKMLALEQ